MTQRVLDRGDRVRNADLARRFRRTEIVQTREDGIETLLRGGSAGLLVPGQTGADRCRRDDDMKASLAVSRSFRERGRERLARERLVRDDQVRGHSITSAVGRLNIRLTGIAGCVASRGLFGRPPICCCNVSGARCEPRDIPVAGARRYAAAAGRAGVARRGRVQMDPLTIALEAAYFGLFGATLGRYARTRTAVDRDIVLVFGTTAALFAISILTSIAPALGAISPLSVAIFLAQPWLIVRLVRHFR